MLSHALMTSFLTCGRLFGATGLVVRSADRAVNLLYIRSSAQYSVAKTHKQQTKNLYCSTS